VQPKVGDTDTLPAARKEAQTLALTWVDWRSNIVASDLVQQSAVADAQQLSRPFAIPPSPPESAADGNDLRFIAEAAQR